MGCTNIKQFLSEYIDAVLDESMKKMVEEHLSTCRKCSEELESLRTYVKALNSLEEVEAPDNFLEKVHRRLEQHHRFKEIAHKLFVPVRIKIPLELVGATAMVILIIYIFNTIQPIRKMANMSLPVTDHLKNAEKEEEESVELAFKKEKTAPAAAIPKDISATAVKEKRGKTIELALLIKLDKFREESRGVGADKYNVAQKSYAVTKLGGVPLSVKEGESKGEVEVLQRDVSVSTELMPKPEGIDELKSGEKAEEPKEIPKAKKTAVAPTKELGGGDRNELSLQYSNEIVSGVKNLIELAGGKVISVEYEKDTNLPQSLNVEIPAEDYGIFLEKLGQFGQLQEPLPSITVKGKDSEPVQLRIGLILSN